MSSCLQKRSEERQELRAAVFNGPGDLGVRRWSFSGLQNNEVLVRVKACGICGSDLNIFHRDPPVPVYWAGHEISGTVEQKGRGVRSLKKGARVSLSPLVPCQKCALCRGGRENLCASSTFVSFNRPGGFADMVVVPAANVFEIPDGIEFDEAVLVEPFADALHAIRVAGPVAGRRALVIGCGTLGLLTIKALKLSGASYVAALGRHAYQRELALSMGADFAIDPEAEYDESSRGEEAGFNLAFETAGGHGSHSITTSIQALEPGGIIILSGVHYNTPRMNLKDLTEKEIQIRGAQRYRKRDFVRALGFFAEGLVQASSLITHKVPLEEIMKGFDIAFNKKTSKAVKVVVCP
ncbi:MAG: zinc-binding dehydrogenase [Thermodesulfobacteriota bacterium]